MTTQSIARSLSRGALLLLAMAAISVAGERAQGNLVEYQGKLYILQPTDTNLHGPSGTFASGKPADVFKEMVMGTQPHADLWDKVDEIYEVAADPAQTDVLRSLESKWIDVEGTVETTLDQLSEDPKKRAIKKITVHDMHNPALGNHRQMVRRTWAWVANVSSGTYMLIDDLTFGGATVTGPGRAELDNYLPKMMQPAVPVTNQPAVPSGILNGPRVRVEAYVHMSPQGRTVYAVKALESISEVTNGSATPAKGPVIVGGPTLSGPGAAQPLVKTGLPTTAPVVPAPGGPVVVSGPSSPATGLPAPHHPAANPATAPATTPATTPATVPAANPVAVPANPAAGPITVPMPGAAGTLKKTMTP